MDNFIKSEDHLHDCCVVYGNLMLVERSPNKHVMTGEVLLHQSKPRFHDV